MKLYDISRQDSEYAVSFESKTLAVVKTKRIARAVIYMHLATRLLTNEKNVSLTIRSDR
jgi:hypothetical protein